MSKTNLAKRFTALLLTVVMVLSLNPITAAGFLPSGGEIDLALEQLQELEHSHGSNENNDGDQSQILGFSDTTDTAESQLLGFSDTADTDEGPVYDMSEQELFGFSSIEMSCAFCVVENMGPGWNLGNTFDYTHIGHSSSCSLCIPNPSSPPSSSNGTGIWNCGGTTKYSDRSAQQLETQWIGGSTNATTQALITNVYNAGFRTIRIPVTWYKATGGPPSWTIRADYMARVKNVVNWAYNAGVEGDRMTIILNTHHEELIYNEWLGNTNISRSQAYITRIWEQICAEFNNGYDERLIFEGLNEPRVRGDSAEWNGGSSTHRTNLNALAQTFVNTVRASGGNNQYRMLMVPTYAASATTTALNGFERPNDPTGNTPNRIILSVHAYEPNNFAGVGSGPLVHTWTEANVTTMMNRVTTRATALGVPVVFGEWGAVSRSSSTNETTRANYASFYAQEAARRGFSQVWWDNGATNSSNHNAMEGNFGLFHRRSGTWTGTPSVPHMGLVFPNITNAIRAGHTAGIGQRGASKCQCPVIPIFTSPNNFSVQQGTASNMPLTADSVSAVTFSFGTPAPPAGVTISGTPPRLNVASTVPNGSYVFQIRATNSQGTATQSFALNVSATGAPRGRNYRNLTLTPHHTNTGMRFTWHSGSPTGGIEIWQQGQPDTIRTIASTRTDSFVVERTGSEGGLGDYNVHQLTVTNLLPNTVYQYVVTWDVGKSSPKTFRTGGANTFQFFAVGDIQIGTGGIEYDREDWTNLMSNAAAIFPQAQFILSAGDQVSEAVIETGGNAKSPTPLQLRGAQRRFDSVFSPNQMHSLPFAPVTGNHDVQKTGSAGNNMNPFLWHRHYNFTNISSGSNAEVRRHASTDLDTDVEFDYWFRYGNVLFIQLDGETPNFTSTSRRTWFDNVVTANADATWRVVSFHYSPYSANRPSNQSPKPNIIANWIPVFEANDIDIVFSGHDHVYSRSHHMRRGSGSSVTRRLTQRWITPTGAIQQGEFGTTNYAVLNPEGIAYISLGSVTRSNARPAENMASRDYILRHHSANNGGTAAAPDPNLRHFSTVSVTPDSFSVATYTLNNAAAGVANRYTMVDLYTIVKNSSGNTIPPGTVIPQFDNTPTDVPDPYTDIRFNWDLNLTPEPDRNVSLGGTNHIRVLSGLEITPCMIEPNEDFTVTMNFNSLGNNSTRRFVVWTDLSGAASVINNVSFLTTANIVAGNAAVSPRINAGDSSATVTIPRGLITSGTNTATKLYVAITIDAGETGFPSGGVADRYTNTGDHRGHSEFAERVANIRFNSRAVLGIGNPVPCPPTRCNNLPCRCDPSAPSTVTFNLAGGTRTGGGELVQIVAGGNAATPPTAYREGYRLTGWDTPFNNITTDITVTAVWRQAVGSNVTIVSTGTGHSAMPNNPAEQGETVTLNAGSPPANSQFVSWTSSQVTITNPTMPNGATFTMPNNAVTVTANWETVVQQPSVVTWPTGLTAVTGQTVSQIPLPGNLGTPGTFSWFSPTSLVGAVGTRTHVLRFTPDNTYAFTTVNQSVSVNVTATGPMTETVIYDMQTTNRHPAAGFAEFAGTGALPSGMVSAFAPLTRGGGSDTTFAVNGTAGSRSIAITNRNGVSQTVRLTLGGTEGLGSVGMPTVAGSSYRIEYTARFPNASAIPRLRFESLTDASLVPGGVLSGGHVLVDAAASVPANTEFTHSVTLTREQLVAIGSRTLNMSETGNTANINISNVRIIQLSPAPIPTLYPVSMNGAGTGATVSKNPAEAGDTISINAGTRAGYSFTGWTSAPSVGFANASSASTSFNMAGAPVTLVANWQVDASSQFTVTIATNGGNHVSGGQLSQQISNGGTATAPVLERSGWVLTGWTSSAAGNPAFSFTTPITANITITAQWSRLGALSSGGTGSVSSADVVWLARAIAGHSGFAKPAPTDPMFAVADINGDGAVDAADITAFMRWLVGWELSDLRG
ncbi:MAG: cellulase family glycosylhydrolase [Defluviitaleaceae bacterium]|nr:cellulase family glycosylhydrolase [Defluviitaleaceae bacterium]